MFERVVEDVDIFLDGFIRGRIWINDRWEDWIFE
jgi:hypothetical protein